MTPARLPDELLRSLVTANRRALALNCLERAHQVGREYVALHGRLTLLEAEGAAPDVPLDLVSAHAADAILELLAPYRCPWCEGSAELPDGCSRCWLALRHYARGGAQFAGGSACAHAFRDHRTTHCGLSDGTLRPGVIALHHLPRIALCRRCLAALIREHAAAGTPLARRRWGAE